MADDQIAGVSQNLIADGQAANAQEGQQPVEAMLPQSKVIEIVQERVREAAEKARREALAQSAPQTMGGMPGQDVDQIRQLVAEETQRQHNDMMSRYQQEQMNKEASRIAGEYRSQVDAGKSHYSDYDDVTKELDPTTIPHIVQLAHATGNAADLMYELGKNPGKIASLTTLAYLNPKLAQTEAHRMVKAIQENKTAANSKTASEPLSQIKPSSTVGVDNGSQRVKDLRRQSWLKG